MGCATNAHTGACCGVSAGRRGHVISIKVQCKSSGFLLVVLFCCYLIRPSFGPNSVANLWSFDRGSCGFSGQAFACCIKGKLDVFFFGLQAGGRFCVCVCVCVNLGVSVPPRTRGVCSDWDVVVCHREQKKNISCANMTSPKPHFLLERYCI